MASFDDYKFENIQIGSEWRPLYIGEATIGLADDDPRWSIYRLTWIQQIDGTITISEIKERTGVAWSDRTIIDW